MEILEHADLAEIYNMKDILDDFGIDHHTFIKYRDDSVGKKRGLRNNGRKYYSIVDIAQIMNMSPKGVKALFYQFYSKKNDLSASQRLWIDVVDRIKADSEK